MGIDMRVSSGRYPSFLVAGCILLYIVFLCNWWSLSSQNYELLNQINILETQIKICSKDKNQCIDNKEKLDVALDEVKVKINQERSSYDTVIKKKENNLSICKTELASLKIVDASKTQSLDALRTTLEEKKEEIKQLNEQIKVLNSGTTDIYFKNHKNTKDSTFKNEAIDGTAEPIEMKEDGERDQEMKFLKTSAITSFLVDVCAQNISTNSNNMLHNICPTPMYSKPTNH